MERFEPGIGKGAARRAPALFFWKKARRKIFLAKSAVRRFGKRRAGGGGF
jgi:hypothetical protein